MRPWRSTRAAIVAAAAVGGLVLGAVPASGVTRSVTVGAGGDDVFDPRTVRGRVGDTVEWSKTAGDSHNVNEENRIFRSGGVTDSAFTFRRIVSSGTFFYWCEAHRSDGMTGFVRVPVRIRAAPAGRNFTVRWATSSTNTGRAHDIQFKVGSGRWRNWKKNTTANGGVFGKNRNPVRVRSGKRYSFRARSQNVNGSESRWSSVRSFRP